MGSSPGGSGRASLRLTTDHTATGDEARAVDLADDPGRPGLSLSPTQTVEAEREAVALQASSHGYRTHQNSGGWGPAQWGHAAAESLQREAPRWLRGGFPETHTPEPWGARKPHFFGSLQM